MEAYPYADLPGVPRLSLSRLALEEQAAVAWKDIEDRRLRESTIVKALLDSLRDLRNDHVSGAKDLATKALGALIEIAEHGAQFVLAEEEITRREGLKDYTPQYFTHRWWNFVRHVAWFICKYGRPSMGAAIKSTLMSSIEQNHLGLRDLGNKEIDSVSEILTDCHKRLQQDLEYRKSGEQKQFIGAFAKELIINYLDAQMKPDQNHPTLTVLTLSNSSTTVAALLACLELQYQAPETSEKTYIWFNVKIAESRPLCEGATLARRLLERAEELGFADRLSIEIASDFSVAHLASGVDLVFLGADRVSRSGAVLNKMGSLPLALCAKSVTGGRVKVAAICEKEKITLREDITEVDEENDRNELSGSWGVEDRAMLDKYSNVKCRNVYFEWVPSEYIDHYVCDTGLLTKTDIKTESLLKADLWEQLFSDMD